MSALVSLPQTQSALPGDASIVSLPGPSQFAGIIDLIKTVLQVPAVTVTLHGAPGEGERGVFRAFLEIPLLRKHKPIGSLRILDTADRNFNERDCVLLESFARLIVEQVDLWAEASRDVLTGAMTRRAFDNVLHKAFAANQRQRGDASLILFDLDHFKSVNDKLGHAAGDAVLRATARTVLRELRVEDSFGRVGGEEFAILVSGADVARAMDVADRVRRAIARMVVPDHDDLVVTASFGVVSLSDSPATPEALMQYADAALYKAKSTGRNRVVEGSAEMAMAF